MSEHRPVSRQMDCPACPHEHHLQACDFEPCDCESPPIPGITLRRSP